MSIGSSVEELWLVLLLLLPALLGLPLLLGTGLLLARVLRQRPAVFAPGFALAVFAAALLGGSLALDVVGRPTTAVVTSKDEQVQLRRQGDWRHRLRVELQYPAASLAGGERIASTIMDLAETPFDRLRVGEPAQLRVLPLWRSLALVAPAESSTATRLPWGWLASGAVVLGLSWAVVRRWGGRAVLAVVACLLLAAIGGPLAGAYRDWRSLESADARPLRAQATVRTLSEITTIDPLPCRPGSGTRCERSWNSAFAVPQPYTIVQLSFVPQGGRDTVVAVAAVDTGSVSLREEQSVTLAYAPQAPRDAQIVGGGNRHRWLNPLAAAGVAIAPLIVIALILLGLIALTRRGRVLKST